MSVLHRALFCVGVVILSAGSASAVPTDLRVLFDSDNNASTGCTAFGFAGVEHVLTTTLETAGTPRVLSAARQSCAGGTLASPVVIDNAGWPAAFNASSGNFTAETKLARSLFGTSPPAGMRVRFLATSGSASGSLVRDANGNPILFPAGLSRRRTAPGSTPRRVITLDGATGDWNGIPPLATGGANDGTRVLRLIKVYGFMDEGSYYFRFDGQANANAPTAEDDSYAVDPGATLNIAAPGVLANDTDPRSLPLAAALVDSASHGALVLNADGSFSYVNDGTGTLDVFTYQATNGEQTSNVARAEILIGAAPNQKPQGVDDDYTVSQGGSLVVTAPGILVNDTDPDGDTLTAVLDTPPSAGTVLIAPDGSFTYNNNGTTGVDSFTYVANDGQANSLPVTVRITVTPDLPPSAVNDAYTVAEGGTLNISAPGVMSNDTDPDTAPASLFVTLNSTTTRGSLSLSPNGSFTYIHNGSETFSDSFTYVVNDGRSSSNVATVTITVTPVNDIPVAGANAYTTNEDTQLTVVAPGVLGNDSDGEGSGLTAVVVTTTPNGTLTLNANGGFVYMPNPNFFGTDSFTYSANDGTASSAPASVTITVTAVNDPPSFTGGGNVTVNEGSGPYSAAWATAISAGAANESAQTLTFNVSNNNNGLFAVQPSISSAGLLTFTPATNASGAATVTVTLQDSGTGANTSAPQTFTITVTAVNNVPSFTAGPNQTVAEDGGPQTVAGFITAISAGPADESAQTVTFTVTNTNNALFSAQPSIAPDGTLTYTPAPNANGTVTVSVTATDNGTPAATSAPQTFTITITPVNDAPSFTAGPDVTADSSAGAQTVNPWATAISSGPNESQNLSFEITNNSAPGLFSSPPSVSPTGVLTFTPLAGASGVATIQLRLRDDGLTANGGVDVSGTSSFTISLDGPPAVTSSTPAASAVVATNSNVTVTFSESVTPGPNWFQLVCTSATFTTANSAVSGGPAVFVIDPNSDLAPGDACTLTVTAAQVTDNDAIDPPNAMAANFVVSFSVDAAPAATITPATSATGIAANANITVVFSEPVDAAASAFTISCTLSGAHTFALSGGPSSFTLNPDSDFVAGESCTATVLAAQVSDQDAIDPPQNMLANAASTFTMDVAPSVAATVPSNGATVGQADADVTVTFSEPVNVTGAWFQIICTTSGTRNVGDTLVTGGPTTFTINPNADFVIGETCTMTVFAAQVDDQDTNDPPANMAADYVFSFLLDQPPAVIATTPLNGATGVVTNSDVTVTFSENVNVSASSFTIGCTSSGSHAFTLSGSGANYTLGVTTDFVPGETCTVTAVAAQISDADLNDPPDNLVSDYVFSFAVDAAPAVTSTTPANGAADQATTVTISVSFSEPVNATTSSFTLECPSGTPRAFNINGEGSSTVNIIPTLSLPAGTTCTVTVLANQIDDVDTNDPPAGLTGNYVFSFSTDFPPSVVSTTPANGAANIGTSSTVTVNFNESVTATGSGFTFVCGAAQPFSVSGSNSSAIVLTPLSPLPEGTLCTVTVVGNQIIDDDGNDPPNTMSPDYVFTFTTDAPPAVTATTPVNSATGVLASSNITVTFNEPVNVTGNWFQIVCGSQTKNVLDTAVTGGPTAFTINPSSDLLAGNLCSVTIFAAQVSDQDAGDPPNNMAGDYAFSFSVPPVTVDDTYAPVILGNVGVNTANSTNFSILTNDTPSTGATINITVPPVNGTVTMNVDGSGRFTYVPAAGYEGADSFKYTLTGAGGTSNESTVSLTVSGMIWFINLAASAGDGRLLTPFNTLGAFNAINNGAGNNPAPGDNVFLYENAAPYTGPVTLLANQKLIGQDATATLAAIAGVAVPADSFTLPAMSGAAPASTITSASAGINAVNLGSNNTIRGLSITTTNANAKGIFGNTFGTLAVADLSVNTSGPALDLTTGTLIGTFNASSSGGSNNIVLNTVAGTSTITGTLAGATGNALAITGGTIVLTFNGNITGTAGNRAVSIINKNVSGNVTINAAINPISAGGGINLDNNDNTLVSFRGGMNISSGALTAFNATNGGTVEVCDDASCSVATGLVNTLASTTGTALNVQNTTISASGLTFLSISANGGTNGIALNSTGSGGLTVTGTGTTAGSGGTIQNTTSRGATFISASNISLKNMNFTNTATVDAVPANTGLSLGNNLSDNAAIHLQTVTTAAFDRIAISGSSEQGINGNTVSNFSLTNSSLVNTGNSSDEDGLHFFNMLGTNVITSTTITSSGDDNVNIQNNSGVSTITITGGSFNTGVQGSGLLFGPRGTTNTTITISGVTCDNNFSGGVVADASDTATMSVEVSGATLTNNNDAIQVSGASGNVKFDLHDNANISSNDFVAITVLKAAFSVGGTLQGKIRNNNITIANGRTADALSLFQAGAGTLRIAVTGNTINYGGTQRAILLQGGQDGNGVIEANITGNTIDVQLDGAGNAVTGILAQTAITGPGNTTSMCADIGGAGGLRNTFTYSLGGTMASGDIRVRQRESGTVSLPGYGGSATDTAAVATYLNSRNTVISASTASAFSTGFAGSAGCTQPTFP